MTKVWMLWHGGASYAAPATYRREDCEAFASMRDAKDEFVSRTNDRRFPAVEKGTPESGGPAAFIYLSDPFDSGSDYPDYTMHFGPRGGVRLDLA